MALIDLQQTDTAATCSFANFCQGGPDATTPQASDARSGGSAGSGTPAVTLNQGETAHAGALFVSPALGVTVWASGTHTFRYNVTTAGANCLLLEVHVCRVNSSCVNQETLGSITGLTEDLAATGVKTVSITGVSGTTALTTDKLAYVLVMGNSHGHNNRTHNYTPNQIINTPIDDGVGGGGRRRAHAS